ncbi:hypothetical protein ACSBR1_032056 [Camellia fascicularis]
MGKEKPKSIGVWPAVKPFVNGGASGMLATYVIQPIDMIKGRVNISTSSGAREMAATPDTALLQALLLTGLSSAAVELLKEKESICWLARIYKCNAMHRKALKLLHQLVESSKSDQPQAKLIQKFKPEMIIDYVKV